MIRLSIVAAVCHGPSALYDLQLTNGNYLLSGKTVTGYSDREEKAMMLFKYLPFSLEDKLRTHGADYEQAALPFKSCVRKDGRIVTGQNPASTKGVAKHVVALLNQT